MLIDFKVSIITGNQFSNHFLHKVLNQLHAQTLQPDRDDVLLLVGLDTVRAEHTGDSFVCLDIHLVVYFSLILFVASRRLGLRFLLRLFGDRLDGIGFCYELALHTQI